MRRQYTQEQRSELIDLVTAGGVTIREAATRLGVGASTASYWVRKAAKTATAGTRRRPSLAAQALTAPPPTFLQLVHAGDTSSSITIRIGNAAIEVRRGFDAELLRAVAVALGGGAA